MKTTLLLLLSFLFFIFSSNLMLNAAAKPVLDITGDEVQPGFPYNIVSAYMGAGGGGLKLQRPGLLVPCPPILVQSPSDLDGGDAWYIQSVHRRGGPVQIGDIINIHSDYDIPCLQNTWWTVSNQEDKETGSYLINVANSGPSTFSIQSVDPFSYRLVYVGANNQTSDVGIQEANGVRRLALTNDTSFEVIFYPEGLFLKENLQKM